MINNIEARAAETLLERGISIKIDAPFLFKIAGKRVWKLTIKQPHLGTLLLISREINKMHVDVDKLSNYGIAEGMQMVEKYAKNVCRIIAFAVLNSRVKIQLFGGLFSAYLRRNVKPYQLYQIMYYTLLLSGVMDFLNTIRLASTMRITQPRNLSQDDQGS